MIHDDNSQSSHEEVERVEALVNSFLGLDFVSDRGETTGQITTEDILVVAPYNLQVKRLQSTLEKLALGQWISFKDKRHRL